MPGVSFQFSAKDNSTKVFKSFNKSINDLNKNLKNMQKTLKSLSNIFSMTFGVIGRVVSSVVNLAVNIIKKGLSTIKNLVTGAFNFIKSALTTLLGWMKKALGTVFDWIASGIKTAFNGAAKVAKAGVKTLVSSIQAYADKQYNTIQLRVGLGNSYNGVMKEFNELLRMSTADRNDLLSVFATFTEAGKSPADIVKYARATVYLTNATGKSMEEISRMLLGQEQVTGQIEKTLRQYGVNISVAKADLMDVEKIISLMGPEMEALASDSLSQSFANVKNDLIGIRENLGALFARPVKYVADKLDALLQKVLGSNKISGLTDKLNAWFDKVKPFIDKVFDMFEKILNDPAGFFKALWSDIQTLFSNIWDNLGYYFKLIGQTLGMSISYLIDWLKTNDFSGFTSAVNTLSASLQDFVIGLGQGLHWWTEEDVVEGSLKQTFINAWNKAHPDFTLDSSDKWYQNLGMLLDAAWEKLIVPAWSWVKEKLVDPITDWLKGDFATVMGQIFSWLGELLGSVFTNFLLQSDTLRTILSAVGLPIATRQDQTSSYEKVKDFLPQTIAVGNAWRDFRSTDLTSEFLNSKYTGKGFTGTWMQYLETVSGLIGDDLNILRRVARADKITENATVPSISDLFNRIDAALNPAVETVAEAVEDTTDVITGTLIPTLSEADQALKDAARELKSHVVNLHVQGTSTGYGKGGIQDYYGQNEFKVYPYSEGGPVLKPTLALIGEDGPEFVLSNDMLKAMKRTTGGGGVNSIPGWHLDDTGKWVENDLWYDIGKLWEGAGKTMTEGVDNLKNFFKPDTSPKERTTGGGGINDPIGMFLDRNGVWRNDDWLNRSLDRMAGYIEDILKEGRQDGWHVALTHITADAETELFKGMVKFTGLGMKGLGFIAGQGGFGSHLGNIYGNSFDENGTFSWMKMFGAIIQEFLPYLQKGLELVGGIFDKAFDILGNAVMKLGEEISTTLLPLLESFIPFMKVLADIVTSLAPVVSSVLAPAIYVICAVLQVLTGLLDWLMPAFAGIGAVIQWVSDAITWAIGSFINWLASWIPWIDGVGEVHRPDSIKGYYNSIMGAYNDAKNTGVNASMAAAQTASQTVSYSGATHITINNDFAGSYIVGSDGMSELALIMANQLDNMGYLKVNIA